jgi:hypothetical protein
LYSWLTALCARPASGAVDVPELAIGGHKYSTDEEKATILIDTFFLMPPTPEEPDNLHIGRDRGREI